MKTELLPDQIRSDIADVIYRHFVENGAHRPMMLADAVLAELCFDREERRLDDGSASSWVGADGSVGGHSKPQTRQERYVTPWTEVSP